MELIDMVHPPRYAVVFLTFTLLITSMCCFGLAEPKPEASPVICEEQIEIEDETIPLASGERGISLRTMVLRTLPAAALIAVVTVTSTLLHDQTVLSGLKKRHKDNRKCQ